MYKNAEKLIPALEAETERFYKLLDNSRRIDNEFAVPPKGQEDAPLTEEEIAEIDAFWGKYKFAYPNIDYQSFQTFKNRCGKFSVYHCPGAIRTRFFAKHFVNPNYEIPFQNKAMLELLYPDIHKPRTLVRRMNGIYYDEQYAPISLDQAVKICCDFVKNEGNMLIKPSGAASSGGHGIIFLNKFNANPLFVKNAFLSKMGAGVFVVQQQMVQSEFMSRLNASSVNTIRITSILHKGEVRPLAALIRVGKAGNGVDAYYAGGCIVGIDIETGKCNPWALASDHSRITVLPSGVDLAAQELVVPNFEQVKADIIRSHYRCPYVKMISWDIALDENNVPTMLECNFAGMMQLHEAVSGPLFGDLMEELLDEYLLERFFLRFATEDFICREFHDRVVVEEYIGASGDVSVPETLRGKPVTKILPQAFKGCTVKKFSAPVSVMKNSPAAMKTI